MKKLIFFTALLASSLFLSTAAQSENRVIRYNGKITPKDTVEIYAHRAGRGLMPEQTFAAYRGALRLGVDYVDMDVNMTKDGVLVITHDLGLNPNLTRDPEGNWRWI
jgi:glycerophosphoryl diester phosphodiesterase